MSYPPPLHSYQRGMVRNGGVDVNGFWPSPAAANIKHSATATLDEPAEITPSPAPLASVASPPSTTDVSPIAELHQALLSQKRAAQAAMVAEAAAAASPAASASFVSTAHAFPALSPTTPTAGRCAVHAIHSPTAHVHSHAHAHPAASSSSSRSHCNSGSGSSNSNNLKRASFWNTRCSCIFSALPDELLLFNVFSFLTAGELCAVAPVCSRWKFLSTDRLLWRKVDLAPHARAVDPVVFDNVLSRVGADVASLKLCNLKLLDGPALRRLGQEHLSANNGALRELHFCSLKAVDFDVMQSLLRGGGGSGSNRGLGLRELSLFGCINVDDACVRLIKASCPRLEDLSLRGCTKVTDAAFIEEVVEEAEDDQPEDEAEEDDKGATSPDNMLAHFRRASRSSSLASSDSFSLTSSSSFSSSSSSSSPSSSSSSLVGSFAHLTSLNVANCKLLSHSGLAALFRGSPLLQKLNLHGLNASDGLLEVLTGCCPLLESLHLSSANPFGGNLALTDRGVELLAHRLPGLQQLNLQGSSKITDACIPVLVQRCVGLEKLNLGGCFRLTDAGVRALAQPAYPSRTRISHLSLFQCVHLTDHSLHAIAHHMPSVQHLDMHSCASITDRALQALMQPILTATTATPSSEEQQQQQQKLASLQEESLDEIAPQHGSPTAASAAASLSSSSAAASPSFLLPLLHSLDVGSCRKISKEQVAQLKAVRTNLIITHY